ncbi:hypothetical protein OG384_07070 [Streptomyces sp. NBC_01324]|nr:hypothetical protein OG384_07070 [Streptomyces sp. NBC_01324]
MLHPVLPDGLGTHRQTDVGRLQQLPVQPGRALGKPRRGRREPGRQPLGIEVHGEQPVRRQRARRREGVLDRFDGCQPLVLREAGVRGLQPAAEHLRQPVRLRRAGERAHRVRNQSRAGLRREQ